MKRSTLILLAAIAFAVSLSSHRVYAADSPTAPTPTKCPDCCWPFWCGSK